MFAALESGIGLDVVIWLQTFEQPSLNAIAELLAILGGTLGYLILLPLIYWSVDRRLGQWLLVVLTTALFVLIGTKEFFGRPRPFLFASEQVQLLISPSTGFGFPSGHVGLTMALWGFVVLWMRQRWGYMVLALYVLLMAWARMYGGVHYPQDVLGGFVLGSAIAGGIYMAREPLTQFGARIPVWLWSLLLIVGSAGMAWLLIGDESGVTGAGILLGGGFGLLLSNRMGGFVTAGSTRQQVLRFVVGTVCTIVVYGVLKLALDTLTPEPLFRVVRYGLVTFTIIGLVPLILRRLGLVETEV